MTAESGPIGDEERAELERLRAEVARLHAAEPGTSAAAKSVQPGHRTLRWWVCGLLVVVMGVLLLGSVVARYARSQVLDTDRYVATVAPLASDPAIQNELSDKATAAITSRVDIAGLTSEALDALRANAPDVTSRPLVGRTLDSLPPIVASQAQSLIHQTVSNVVRSDRFQSTWEQLNRDAHQALTAVVTGRQNGAVRVDDKGTVSISLAPLITMAQQRLDEQGVHFADNLPQVNANFVVLRSPDIVKAQRWVRVLDTTADWLPWLAVVAGLGAIWVAPRRLRALALVGLGGVVSMGILAIGLGVGHAIYLHDIPPDVLSPSAATALIDAILDPLRTGMRAVFVIALVVLLVAYLAGPSRSAVAVRRGFGKGLAYLRRPLSGRTPSPVERFVATYATPVRIVIIAGAVLTLVLWEYPTGMVVLWTAVVAVVLLLAVEFVARPVRASAVKP